MIKLTQTVQKGGCAAKVAATELRKILSQVQFPPTDANVMVDGGLFDDAAIYRVHSDLALVQTLDFFTPIVDTPRIFGQIAAANSLSDVYAMGGVPKTAMGILAFPLAQLPNEVVVEVLQGGCDVMKQTKVSFVGGHSIDDDTLKFGLSVTGFVHPEWVWSNAKAREGDALILTKPLGTGTATAALKRQHLQESDISEVIHSMTQVNSIISHLPEALLKQIHAATDITGFGLAGHCVQMAKASQQSFQIEFQKLPKFQVSQETIKQGFLTKAHKTNALYVRDGSLIQGLSQEDELFLYDPQTSGGLLLSVKAEVADEMVRLLKNDFPATCVVGSVQKSSEKFLKVI